MWSFQHDIMRIQKMASDLDHIKINYGLNGDREPVVVMSFSSAVDGAVLTSMEARTLAKHLYDAALNAELSQRNSKPVR